MLQINSKPRIREQLNIINLTSSKLTMEAATHQEWVLFTVPLCNNLIMMKFLDLEIEYGAEIINQQLIRSQKKSHLKKRRGKLHQIQMIQTTLLLHLTMTSPRMMQNQNRMINLQLNTNRK